MNKIDTLFVDLSPQLVYFWFQLKGFATMY